MSPAIFAFIFRVDLSPKKANNKLQHIDDVDVVKLTCHAGGSDRDLLGQRPLSLCPWGALVTRQSRGKRPPSGRSALCNTANAV
jgi:hypothetical protein